MERTNRDLIIQTQAGAADNDVAELDLLELVYHIMDKWKLVVACMLAGMLLMLGVTKLLMVPQYEATSKMYVLSSSDSVVNLSDLQLGTYLASDYIEVFTTHEVTDAVIQNLSLQYTYEEMQELLTITNPSGTRILYITVTMPNPVVAAAISNEFLKVASQYIAQVMVTDQPTVLSVALPPDEPVSPNLLMNLVLGAAAAVFIVCTWLVVKFVLDDKVKSGEDITKLTGLPIFAEVPVFTLNQGEKSRHREG